MNIVYLTDDFPPLAVGGAGFSTFELAQAVMQAGHEVSVVTTCREAGEASETTYEGLRVYRIASTDPGRRFWASLYKPRVVRELDNLLARLAPDVVHANNVHLYLSWASLAVAKRHAKHVVWTARDLMAVSYGKLYTSRYLARGDARLSWRDNLSQAGTRFNPLYRLAVRRYLGCVDKRYAVSDALCEALHVNGIRDVEAIHTGIDPAVWGALPGAVAEFKAHFGLREKKVILFAGRLSRDKGGEQVVAALEQVVKETPSARLLVVGQEDGYGRGMLERAKARGLAGHIVFTGWVAHEEMRAAYGAADLVWVPSVYLDPFPRTVLEAMASGRPVVGTTYGGAQEAIKDGVTGYVVDPFDVHQWAEKTAALLTDPARAAAFGEAARGRITQDFGLAQYAARYIAAYEGRSLVE